jgi:FKBP-type peptidyl-prolyl cis-trans isomerase SlpA
MTVTTLPTVQAGSFLTLHYRMSGPSGVVVDTFDAAPATLTLGTGALSPAIEAGLIGLEEGCRTSIELPAGAAFGPRSPDMQQWLSLKELNALGGAGERFEVGEVVKFPTPDGQGEFAGVIREFRSDAKGEAVLFDFNHPLAGQPVRFDVQVIGVL